MPEAVRRSKAGLGIHHDTGGLFWRCGSIHWLGFACAMGAWVADGLGLHVPWPCAWPASSPLTRPVCHARALPAEVDAQLYKLLLYEPGSHFKPHRDSPKGGPDMFGTLSIMLPSAYEVCGGWWHGGMAAAWAGRPCPPNFLAANCCSPVPKHGMPQSWLASGYILPVLPCNLVHPDMSAGRPAGGAPWRQRGGGGHGSAKRQGALLCSLLRRCGVTCYVLQHAMHGAPCGIVFRHAVPSTNMVLCPMPCHAMPCHAMLMPCSCLPCHASLTFRSRLRARDPAGHCWTPPVPDLQPRVCWRRPATAHHPRRCAAPHVRAALVGWNTSMVHTAPCQCAMPSTPARPPPCTPLPTLAHLACSQCGTLGGPGARVGR